MQTIQVKLTGNRIPNKNVIITIFIIKNIKLNI